MTVRDGKMVYDLNGLARDKWDPSAPETRGASALGWLRASRAAAADAADVRRERAGSASVKTR